MLKRSLEDMFDKVAGVKVKVIKEGLFSQHQAPSLPTTATVPAPMLGTPGQVQKIMQGFDQMGSRYQHEFIKLVTGLNADWTKMDTYGLIAAKKIAQAPDRYAVVLNKFPHIADALQK